jgi:hypothetical protein
MKFMRTCLAAAALLGSVTAHAALVYSVEAPSGSLGALTFTSTSGSVLTPISGSVTNVRLAPLTVGDGFYSVISTGGIATIDFGAGVSTFSFLWGSPDTYNFVDIATSNVGSTTYTGTMLGSLGGFSANGSNANTRLFTISGTDGTLINALTFRATGIAFEVAAAPSPVPLPAAVWLLLSGLVSLGLVGRRRAKG